MWLGQVLLTCKKDNVHRTKYNITVIASRRYPWGPCDQMISLHSKKRNSRLGRDWLQSYILPNNYLPEGRRENGERKLCLPCRKTACKSTCMWGGHFLDDSVAKGRHVVWHKYNRCEKTVSCSRSLVYRKHIDRNQQMYFYNSCIRCLLLLLLWTWLEWESAGKKMKLK